jgi:hypothetical protein
MSPKLSVLVATAIFLSACSQAPKTTSTVGTEARKEPAKAPEAVAARTPYFEMYKSARAWAPDLLALTIKSGEVPNVKNEGGRAGLWVVVFVSPSRREARTFSYAVANAGTDLRKGINISDKQIWNGATPTAKAFANGEFSIDSDAAYEVAQEKAAGWLKTHPKAQATFTLGSTSRFPAPVWYILWGTNKDGYAVYVNAITGKIVTY